MSYIPPHRGPVRDSIGFGRYMDWNSRNHRQPLVGPRLDWAGAESAVLLGPNGSGKDVRIINPMLLQNTGASIVVLDVKGGSAAVTGPFRRTLGPVYIINPEGLHVDIPGYEDLASSGWSPFAGIDPDKSDFAMRSGYHTDALFSEDKGDTSENAAFFKESGKSLWQWGFMKEAIDAKRQNRRADIANVRAFICTPSGRDPVTGLYCGIPDDALDAAKSDIPALRNLASQFTVWNREKEGVSAEAKRHSKNLDDAELVTDILRPGFDFAELKRRVCTVYIVVSPLMLERWSSYIRLIFDSALRAVMRPRAEGEPKVIFVLNEAYALGKLKILGTVQSLLREYGVQLLWCWQSKSQAETVWGAGEAETMLAAAGVVASFRAANMSTAEWLSKRCGDTTAILAGFNQGENHQSHNTGQSSGQTWSQQKIPAVLPHDTFDLNDGQMIQFVSRLADFVSAYAPPFWLIDQCQARARANPFHRPKQER